MTAALTESGARAIYDEAATTLARGLRVERAVIVYLDRQRQLMLGGVFGFPKFHLHDAPISATLLTQVITSNRTVVYGNVPSEPDARENLSLTLSGALSVLCVPFYDEGGLPVGALYADSAEKAAFHRQELLYARECARWLEGCLRAGQLGPAPCRTHSTAPRTESAPAQPARPRELPRRAKLRPASEQRVSGEGLMVFFRSFSTLLAAGVMIHHALDLLADSAGEPGLARVLLGLSLSVQAGEPLSAAMERYPKTFPSHLSSAVRMGERSGRLVQVLNLLATDLEKERRLIYRVRSALTYPAILSVACGALLLLGPPFLLEGHLRMLAQSGVELPWMTLALLWLSNALRGPWPYLALIAFGTGSAGWLRQEVNRDKTWRMLRRVPVLGPILGKVCLVGVTRCLSLQLKAGLTALEALHQAHKSCRDTDLRKALSSCEQALRNGATLAEAFALSGAFSATFVSFVEAGEASGTLPRLVEWIGVFTERELESDLEGLVAMLEPLTLTVMGILATMLLFATLKPTLLLLQTI